MLNPTINTIKPASGMIGDKVVITGEGFTGATGVSFGDTPVEQTDFHVISDKEIKTSVPANGGGKVDVTVTTSVGMSEPKGFSFSEHRPEPPKQHEAKAPEPKHEAKTTPAKTKARKPHRS